MRLQRLQRKQKKQKEQKAFSKSIVTLVIVMNMIAFGALLFAFMRVGSEAGILTGAWFAFTTGELWALALIRRKEIIHGANTLENKEGENEDGQ